MGNTSKDIIRVTKSIIFKAAEIGLDEAGSRFLGSAWPYLKAALNPLFDELKERNPAFKKFFSTGGKGLSVVSKDINKQIEDGLELQGLIIDGFANIENGQREIINQIGNINLTLSKQTKYIADFESGTYEKLDEIIAKLDTIREKFPQINYTAGITMFDLNGAWTQVGEDPPGCPFEDGSRGIFIEAVNAFEADANFSLQSIPQEMSGFSSDIPDDEKVCLVFEYLGQKIQLYGSILRIPITEDMYIARDVELCDSQLILSWNDIDGTKRKWYFRADESDADVASDKPISTTHCPNPNCGQSLQGGEHFCPLCGTKISSTSEDPASDKPAQVGASQATQQIWEMWELANDYLENKPEGEHSTTALFFAEFSKAFLVYHNFTASLESPINYSLVNYQVEPSDRSRDEILNNWWSIEGPKIAELPGIVGQQYICSSFDTQEFKDLVASKFPDIHFDIDNLTENRNEIIDMIRMAFAAKILEVEDRITKKYKSYINDGDTFNWKTKIVTKKVTKEEIRNKANEYYKLYEKGKLEKAQKGFERLTTYNPYWNYLHDILCDIYQKQGKYERAFEEALYSAYLVDEAWREYKEEGKEAEFKRDIFAMEQKASLMYGLGLSPGLLDYLGNLEDEISEEETSSDINIEIAFNNMLFFREMGRTVIIAMANQLAIFQYIQQSAKSDK